MSNRNSKNQLMKIKYSLLIVCSIAVFSSCYYDNEEMLYGLQPCDSSNVTYGVQVVNTLTANCLSCHGGNGAAGGNVRLGTYNDVKVYADNGKLLSSISHTGSSSPMPKNAAKLPECRIAEIRTWIRNGAPNN